MNLNAMLPLLLGMMGGGKMDLSQMASMFANFNAAGNRQNAEGNAQSYASPPPNTGTQSGQNGGIDMNMMMNLLSMMNRRNAPPDDISDTQNPYAKYANNPQYNTAQTPPEQNYNASTSPVPPAILEMLMKMANKR